MWETIITIIFVVGLVVGVGYLIREVAKFTEFEEKIERHYRPYISHEDDTYQAMKKSFELRQFQMEAYQKMQNTAKKHEDLSRDDFFRFK